jgi:solute carrier family 13 (sodium-dependent dicarboxylate transporter), member 2/3/5
VGAPVVDGPPGEVPRGVDAPATPFATRTLTPLAWALSLTVPVALWWAPLPLEAPAQHALAIGSFMILAWVTHILDHAITGLIGVYLFWALKVTDFGTAFHGFATPTPWFLFGVFLFGAMATKSGLARRLAYIVMRAVGHSYPRLLLGLILSDFLLTALVPSGVARVIIMAAVAIGLMDAFGVGPGSNIGRGMFIILTYTANIFDKMIIAGAAAITARGLIEKVGHVEVLWSRWAIAYLPCDLITIFVAWRLTLWLYPPEKEELPGGAAFLSDEIQKMGPWSALEKRSALLLGLAVVLWGTDFLHHVPAPMIGLGIGLLATLPGIGVLTVEDVKKVNLLPVFFVATAICLGEVLTATRGLDVLTNILFASMQPLLGRNPFSVSVVLYWSVFILHFFLGDEVSLLATSIPPLMNFARTQGLDPLVVGMIWTFGAGGKVFVYQSAVLVVGDSYGYFRARDLFVIGAILTVVQFLILLLLVPFYWPLIGIGS